MLHSIPEAKKAVEFANPLAPIIKILTPRDEVGMNYANEAIRHLDSNFSPSEFQYSGDYPVALFHARNAENIVGFLSTQSLSKDVPGVAALMLATEHSVTSEWTESDRRYFLNLSLQLPQISAENEVINKELLPYTHYSTHPVCTSFTPIEKDKLKEGDLRPPASKMVN